MKLYAVIIDYVWDGQDMVGVYDTKEKAQHRLNNTKDISNNWTSYIKEIELNKDIENTLEIIG